MATYFAVRVVNSRTVRFLGLDRLGCAVAKDRRNAANVIDSHRVIVGDVDYPTF